MPYPIRLNVKAYHGKNKEKRLRWQQEVIRANRIEEFINARLSPLPDGTPVEIDYYEIASELNIGKAAVKRILYANGGGSNGITLRR